MSIKAHDIITGIPMLPIGAVKPSDAFTPEAMAVIQSTAQQFLRLLVDVGAIQQTPFAKINPVDALVRLMSDAILTGKYHTVCHDQSDVAAWAWRSEGMTGWALGHLKPTPENTHKFHERNTEVRALTFLAEGCYRNVARTQTAG